MQEKFSHLIKLLRTILLITTVISAVTAVIGLNAKWTAFQFSNAFFAAGGILAVIGVFTTSGGFVQRGNFNMTYAESAGQANIAERTRRMMGDINQRYGATILLVSVGLLLIVIAVVIGNFLPVQNQ